METIDFTSYKVECSKNDDLRYKPQRIELRFKRNTNSGEIIVDRFTCGFYNGSDECVMCKARILEIFYNKSYVPEDKVIKLSQTFEDFPPIV